MTQPNHHPDPMIAIVGADEAIEAPRSALVLRVSGDQLTAYDVRLPGRPVELWRAKPHSDDAEWSWDIACDQTRRVWLTLSEVIKLAEYNMLFDISESVDDFLQGADA